MNRAVYTRTLYLSSEKLQHINNEIDKYRGFNPGHVLVFYEKNIDVHNDYYLNFIITSSNGWISAILSLYNDEKEFVGNEVIYINNINNLVMEFIDIEDVYRLVIAERT